ncbi:hypothetical protein SCHPADRAFT_885592 [Schizopora paradoxa]|uniref:Uncharacterized protein n=1 Tax=Schizopora paradoxa TaxID=27342 RepID=A0A0H2SQ44_9AGAM|nr:hypothetical protein SCHPADRAFT_885592 [Schizopora paradoxa]
MLLVANRETKSEDSSCWYEDREFQLEKLDHDSTDSTEEDTWRRRTVFSPFSRYSLDDGQSDESKSLLSSRKGLRKVDIVIVASLWSLRMLNKVPNKVQWFNWSEEMARASHVQIITTELFAYIRLVPTKAELNSQEYTILWISNVLHLIWQYSSTPNSHLARGAAAGVTVADPGGLQHLTIATQCDKMKSYYLCISDIVDLTYTSTQNLNAVAAVLRDKLQHDLRAFAT